VAATGKIGWYAHLQHLVAGGDPQATVYVALGIRQADDQGRHGFVEVQADRGRRLLHDGTVHGMGFDQSRMGEGGIAAPQHGER
jgi:hypothetical protein